MPAAWCDADGRPAFPNARYVVQRDEAEAAHGDELRVQGIMEVEQLDAVRAAGQLAEVSGEVEVMRGVRVLRTGGHTRGSQAVLIGIERPGGRSGDPTDRAIFWGDLIPTRWQVPVRWTSAYDDYPIDAIEMRNELLGRAAALRAGGATSPTIPATCRCARGDRARLSGLSLKGPRSTRPRDARIRWSTPPPTPEVIFRRKDAIHE